MPQARCPTAKTIPWTPRRTHHKRSLRVESSHLRKPSSTTPPSKASCCATAGSTVGGRTQRRLASPACTWTQRRTPPCSPSSAEPQAFTTSPSPAPPSRSTRPAETSGGIPPFAPDDRQPRRLLLLGLHPCTKVIVSFPVTASNFPDSPATPFPAIACTRPTRGRMRVAWVARPPVTSSKDDVGAIQKSAAAIPRCRRRESSAASSARSQPVAREPDAGVLHLRILGSLGRETARGRECRHGTFLAEVRARAGPRQDGPTTRCCRELILMAGRQNDGTWHGSF